MFTHLNSTVSRAVVGTLGTALCAGLCLVAATAPAAAAEAVRTTTVRYGDLNLGSAAGRATLDRRIAAAARAVCVDSDGGVGAESSCVRTAVAAARAKVVAPQQSAAL